MDNRVVPILKTNTMKNIYKRIIVVLLFVISNLVQAQVTPSPPGFGDDVEDTVPIDIWLVPMLIIAVLMVYCFYKNQIATKA